MLAAGAVAGAGDDPERSGQRAGAQAAHAWAWARPPQRTVRTQRRAPEAVPPAVAGAGRGECFACLCEDVTAKDIHLSVDEGYDSIELSKRYTTATMGPCQGRMCQLPAVRLMAQETGQDLQRRRHHHRAPAVVGRPAGRAGRPPVRARQALGDPSRHRALGAKVMWAGDWRRAYDYGDPEGEALAVHEAAGLIDVSTLGKLIVRGPEAGDFSTGSTPTASRISSPGRIRYGVLTSDAGRITDDGTICRLDDDTFYVTTTSSGAGAVEQWFSWWLADWRMQVRRHRRHPGRGRGQPRGPARPRDPGSRAPTWTAPTRRFAYLDAQAREGRGCPPCLILRIGFVGEVGYEIHCADAHGQAVWDAMLAPARHGILRLRPGAAALLRLQKLHIIVGQDTDSESTPSGAGAGWTSTSHGEDFLGRGRSSTPPSVEARLRPRRVPLPDGDVPTEGAAVLDDGEPAAR